jgi:hypothetical protein
MLGGGKTAKLTPLLVWPFTVTVMFPAVAPFGTKVTILVSVQVEGAATVPLKLTMLAPWDAPKLVPVIVTDVPITPEFGERLVMAGITPKGIPVLVWPFTVTVMFPVVAPLGTGTTILVALQADGELTMPLKLTVLVPCVAPKLDPEMVTDVPTVPEVGETLLRIGGREKGTPLLTWVLMVTTTFPVVAPSGTGVTILVSLQLEGEASAPLKATLLVPWDAPKLVPVIVTNVPTAPEFGDRLVMLGGGITAKLAPLLVWPATVTVTFPVAAPFGTGATMLVALQLEGKALVPLKLTVLLPCVGPKFAPVIVTELPIAADAGDKPVILGGGTTVKFTALLVWPATVTVTFPVVAPFGTGATMLVALQLDGEAIVPLKLIVLVPCVAPKFAPAIVTDVPTEPEAGDKLVMLGGGTTVKVRPLLASPPTVTTTLPVVAPLGTGATMLVALQLDGEAIVPLKLTVLVPCVAPKFAPAIVTIVPTAPDTGDRLAMLATVLPLPAVLNAAILATQSLEGDRVHVVAVEPAKV